jgi:N-acetylglucosaminyl-diphospho-decaprenol L-rhamnosyltransferase
MHRLIRPRERGGRTATRTQQADSAANGRALDVVITSYRAKEYLHRCLDSIRRNPPEVPVTVRVIDNASGDGLADMVTTDFSEVDFTANHQNRGFAAATNAGIQAGETEFVLALNPDTRLNPGALDRLIEVMDEHPEVGICGPVLIRPNGQLDHAASRHFPTPLSSLGHFINLSRIPGAPKALSDYTAATDHSGPVDAVNGAFMLIRRRALEDVGLFDEGFWMYMEDLDLCYRFARAGWVTWYEPTVTVTHVKAGTSGSLRSLRLNYAFHYGMYRFYRKHYARHRGRLTNALIYCGIALKLAASLLRNAIVAAGRRTRGRRGYALTSARAR